MLSSNYWEKRMTEVADDIGLSERSRKPSKGSDIEALAQYAEWIVQKHKDAALMEERERKLGKERRAALKARAQENNPESDQNVNLGKIGADSNPQTFCLGVGNDSNTQTF